MSKRFSWDEVKRAIVDSDDRELSEIRGIWYKNQRYFSNSIFVIRKEGTIAFVDFWKGDLDFKSGGKATWSFGNSGDRGDLECPVIANIGDTPVIVVSEEWKSTGGWNSRPYAEIVIYSYNGGYAQFDGVYEVRGQTFMLNRLLYELGFAGEKTDNGYVHRRPTPEEEAEMSAKEAEERRLWGLAKKKEAEEEKARMFEVFKQAHADGTLRVVIQEGIGYSPITGIKLGEAPEGNVFVFAWYVEGSDVTPEQACYLVNHKLTKKHLAVMGITPVESRNRWTIWFHAVAIESVDSIGARVDYTEYMAAWR